MNKWATMCAIAFSLLTSTCRAEELEFIKLIGDDYFDTGAGNAVATSLGVTLPNRTPPYFNGRRSDGPIWIDFVSELLDVPFTNFAVSGAKTGTGNFIQPALGGNTQELLRFAGTQPPIDSETLIFLDGGRNDFFGLLLTPGQLNPAGFQAVATQAITNQVINSLTLQAFGAKKIIIWNLEDMGKLPLFTDPALGLTLLSPAYTQASIGYNAALSQQVKILNKSAEHHRQIFVFDAFSLFNEITASLEAQGIDPTQHTITILPNGNFVVTGPQPGSVEYYDQTHPTSHVWELVAPHVAAFVDTIYEAPRFIAAERDLAFETTKAFRDAMDNHFRTLHLQRFVHCMDWNQCCNEFDRFHIYFDGLAKWGSTHTRVGTLGLQYDTQLAMLGADYHYNDCLTFGASFTAQRNWGRTKHHHSHMELHDYIPTLYGEYSTCNSFIDGYLSYHYYDFKKIRRHIPYVHRTARGHTHGQAVEANVEAGLVKVCGCTTLIPIVGVDYEYLHIAKYHEKHKQAFHLKVRKQHNDSLVGKIGGQMFLNPLDCGLITFAELYYEQEFLRHRRVISSRLRKRNDGSVIYSKTSSPCRSTLKYAFGFDADLSECMSGNISYQGETTFRRFNNGLRLELVATF